MTQNCRVHGKTKNKTTIAGKHKTHASVLVKIVGLVLKSVWINLKQIFLINCSLMGETKEIPIAIN